MKYIILLMLFLSSRLMAKDYSQDPACVAYWAMEDTGNEIAIVGSDLTDNNTVGRSSTKQYGSYSRDFELDNSEYLSQADNLSTDIFGQVDMSVVMWIKIETVDTATDSTVVSKYDTNSQRQYAVFFYDTGGDLMRFILSSNGTTVGTCQTGNAVNVSTWYHVACTYEDDEASDQDMKIYINGVLDTGVQNPFSYDAGIHEGTSDFAIGCLFSSGTPLYFFDGIVDDVAIFDVPLTITQVNEIMNYGVIGSQIPKIQQYNRRRR